MIGIPTVTGAQMATIDRIMAERFAVAPIQLMEHAGHAIATFTRRLFDDDDALDQSIVFLVGSGGNGGDALVAARLLAAWGARPTVILAKPAAAHTGLTATHIRAITAMGIPVVNGTDLETIPSAAVVVDGLLGSGATGDPTGTTARLITMANDHDAWILAIDVPSGLDATTGIVRTPCIAASGTLTLGLPKTGLFTDSAADVIGSLLLADIGIPPIAYQAIGKSVSESLFSSTWLIPLRGFDDEGEGALRDY